MKRVWAGAGVFIVVAALGVFLIQRSGPEPRFNGHRLSFWLELYTSNPSARATAQTAIRAIGTNALPELLTMMGAKDSGIKTVLLLMLNERREWIHLSGAREYHLMARGGFQALGRMAEPALPGLSKLLNDTDPDIRRNATFSYFDVMGGADGVQNLRLK